jgi:hypothetical protein
MEWYKRIEADIDDAALSSFIDDADIWARVRNSDVDVVLWHGPHPNERIFALRACWHLRDRADRLHEVARPARKFPSGIPPQFYDMVSISDPDVLVKAWKTRSRVADVATRAKRWEALRDESGDCVRVLDDDEIVRLPLTAFDGLILGDARTWTESQKVLGTILAGNAIGFAFLRWRIRELLRDGSLESRGEMNRLGLPTDVRRRDR